MNTVVRTVGGVVGAQVGAVLLAANVAGTGVPAESGFVDAFWIGAVGAVVAAVPRSRPAPAGAPAGAGGRRPRDAVLEPSPPLDRARGAARSVAGRPASGVTPCLGGNAFGWGADEEASFAVLDAYVAAGGNSVDTANVYSAWVPGHRGGETEAIIGRWLAGRGEREDLVSPPRSAWREAGAPRASPGRHPPRLRGVPPRLQVDRIDLYYAHEDDPETPLEETMGALDELVRAWSGARRSNYPAERLTEALGSARRGARTLRGAPAAYNLVGRGGYEGPLQDIAPPTTSGSALLLPRAGVPQRQVPPREAAPRTASAPRRRATTCDPRALAVLHALAPSPRPTGDASPGRPRLAHGASRRHRAVASATSPGQVGELMGAVDLELSDDELLAALTGAPASA